MNYYEVIIDGDEEKNKGFTLYHHPFIIEIDKEKYWEYEIQLQEGKYIHIWDKNIVIYSTQNGYISTLLGCDNYWLIISSQAISVLTKNKIYGFQYLPITVIKQDGHELIDYKHTANIYNNLFCLNKQKSEYTTYGERRPERKNDINHIRKLIIEKKIIKKCYYDIFRLGEYKVKIIASERLVELFYSNNYSGLSFEKLDIA